MSAELVLRIEWLATLRAKPGFLSGTIARDCRRRRHCLSVLLPPVAPPSDRRFNLCFRILWHRRRGFPIGRSPVRRWTFPPSGNSRLNLINDDLINDDLVVDGPVTGRPRSVGGRGQIVKLSKNVSRFGREFRPPLLIFIFGHLTGLAVKIKVADLLEERVLLSFKRLSPCYRIGGVGKICLVGRGRQQRPDDDQADDQKEGNA